MKCIGYTGTNKDMVLGSITQLTNDSLSKKVFAAKINLKTLLAEKINVNPEDITEEHIKIISTILAGLLWSDEFNSEIKALADKIEEEFIMRQQI